MREREAVSLMKEIQSYIQGKLLEIKVIPAQTLFEPVWENLNVCRCPLCGNKLKLTKQQLWMCRGKKHAKPYFITEKRMNELTKNQEKKKEYEQNRLLWSIKDKRV